MNRQYNAATMIVDGNTIAEGIFERIRTRIEECGRMPKLAIVTCAPTFETKKYLALKQRKAAEVGVEIFIVEFATSATTAEMLARMTDLTSEADGIIVQLPMPVHIDATAVLASVPPTHDVDALNPKTAEVLPPVVGALKAILEAHAIPVEGKLVTVLGAGRLVGQPAASWFSAEGASVSIVTKDTSDISHYTKQADIIVCGAGDPGMLTPDMVKEGVVILDAGTSEEGGILKGDADPACAEKASVFTPVPGGVGPITVAILLENLVKLALMDEEA